MGEELPGLEDQMFLFPRFFYLKKNVSNPVFGIYIIFPVTIFHTFYLKPYTPSTLY